MNKTDDQLREEINTSETRGNWGAWALIAGLILEVVLATANSLGYGNRDIENWGAVVADTLVALGVYAEVHFGRRASHGLAELRRRSDEKVALANERSAKLEKEAADARERVAEIERLHGWRHVPDEENFVKLIRAIEPIAASLDVLVEFERGNNEAYSYSSEIILVFASAGVTKIRHIPNQYFNAAFGLALASSSESARQIIQSAFAAAGMSPLTVQKDLSTHLPRSEPAPNVYIFVGAKPPPALVARAPDDAMSALSANEHAAAIETAITPRRVSEQQRENIVRALREKLPLTHDQTSRGKTVRNEGESLLIDLWVACSDDPESRQFSSDLIETFKLARAGNAAPSIVESRVGDLPSGLHVLASNEAELIRQILSEVGIRVERDASFETRFSAINARHRLVRMYVGHRPSSS